LHGVTIYAKGIDYETPGYLLKAKKGNMFRSNDNRFLMINLEDGIRYEEKPGGNNFNPNPRQILTRSRFKSAQYKLDLTGLAFKRTDESGFSRAFQMMNRRLLKDTMGKIDHVIDSGRRVNYPLLTAYIKYFSMPRSKDMVDKTHADYKLGVMNFGSNTQKLSYITNALSEARSVQDLIKQRNERYKEASYSVHSAAVEYQKKFTLSAACLVLFLIGAPLGAIIRKGGLGLPVVVSVVFFLIYHIISTIGEKAVKAGDASAFWGMWIAIIILSPIGLFLSYKAANDSVIFDADIYKRVFNAVFGRIMAAFKRKVNLGGQAIED
jgi:lipopolysaccharide export system permease protein